LSKQHQEWFDAVSLSPDRQRLFAEEAERSWRRQREIEASDTLSFDEFLASYFAQA
jgi:glutamate--cysteine ligase